MSDAFSYIKKDNEVVTVVVMEGTIDEDTLLDDVFTDAQPNIVINLSKITHINSCGIRTWVNTIEKLTETHNVTFIDCSITMVRQFNMISNFGGTGIIQSFKIPYYCNECDKEYDFSMETEEYCRTHPDFTAPEYTCPECNAVLEFDDLEDKYFHFLKTYRKQ